MTTELTNATQTEREADGLPRIVAGAIFDFAGFMTTRAEVIEVGSTAEAGPVADLVKEWAELRGLDLADAAVLSWQLHITRASLPAPQQATPDRHLTVTTNRHGDAVMVSWQDDEHRILEVVWERKPATPEPVGEVLSYKPLEHTAVIKWYPALNGVPPAGFNVGTKLFTRPAPGVPEGFALVPVEPTAAMLHCIVYDQYPQDANEGRKLQRKQLGEPNSGDHVPFKTEFELAVGQYKRLLAAAQAKKGE